MKIKEILAWAQEEIYKGTSSNIPARESEILLEYILKISREKLYIKLYEECPEEYLKEYKAIVLERASGKPLSYITHTKEFMSLPFFVNSSVLIPRPDTEILVEEVLTIAKNIKNPTILDIGTGSGCIGLSIASYLKEGSLCVTDISPEAIAIAKKNADNLSLRSISFYCGDLFEPVQGLNFDIIVSNPPYIAYEEINSISKEVKDYEPSLALFGAEKGLFFYKKIISESKNHFKKEGFLAFETGIGQAEQVSNLMKIHNFRHIKIVKDLSGIERVVTGMSSDRLSVTSYQ